MTTELKRQFGSGPFMDVPLPGITARSVTTYVPAAATTTQKFLASATDIAGNTGTAFSTGKVAAFQETGSTPAITYTGSWGSQTLAGSYGGHVKFASTAGRAALIAVTNATDLAWVSTKGKDRGKADVYIDGIKKATVDLYSVKTVPGQVVYSTTLAAGLHTIRVLVTGTRNTNATGTRVDVDAFLAITS